MSFLNPVNELVKRFKSTDAGAPQINYNARVAGDVKAVLKSCLVTGYGDKASADWTAANEVGNVIEFVSPSAAMSDYRLGIDDASAANTTWYYQYQNTRTNPAYNVPVKAFTYADKTHASNGWQLLVTERGIIFVEFVQHTSVNKLSARITYWGAVKSALTSSTGANICFFNVGQDGGLAQPNFFYSSSSYVHLNLSTNTSAYMSPATGNMLLSNDYLMDVAAVDLVSNIYIASGARNSIIGELPSMLSKIVNKTNDVYGVSELALDGRSVLSICAGISAPLPGAITYSRTFLIPTDYWEY